MTDLRVLLATPHAAYEQRVRRAFGTTLNGDLRRWDVGGDGATPESLMREIAGSSPSVVAIGPDVGLEDALVLAQQIERDRPEISVLLVSPDLPELWQRALRSGVHDIVAPDDADAAILSAFSRALDVADRRRHNLGGAVDDPSTTGRVITVLSPKGGSGKTTIASNLAVGLAQAAPDRTAIIDLDLQFGDTATSLGLTPEHTMVDVVRAQGALDHLTLKSFLVSHPSNLWVLCGPRTPAESEEVLPEQAQQMIRTLAHEFSHVVVDTSAGLNEHTLAALEVSTDLVLLCAMDVPSILGLRKEIDVLDRLGMTGQRRHLVINRADAKVGLSLSEVEATIGMQIDVTIASARAMTLSTNLGSPVLESEPRSPAARQLLRLVENFAEPSVRRGRRLRRERVRDEAR